MKRGLAAEFGDLGGLVAALRAVRSRGERRMRRDQNSCGTTTLHATITQKITISGRADSIMNLSAASCVYQPRNTSMM